MNGNKEKALRDRFTIGLAVLPAAAGSIVTFMFVFIALAGVLDVVHRRVSLELYKYDRVIVYPAFVFFLVNALSVIRLDFEIHDLTQLVPAALFLLLYFAVKRYRYVGSRNAFLLFIKSIPYGALLLLPWIFYEAIFLEKRMVAGAGNSIPYAMICVMMLPICLMNLLTKDHVQRIFAFVGFVIFAFGLVFSQTRSMYIVAIPNLLIALGYLYFMSAQKIRMLLFSALILISSGIFAFNSSIINDRFSQLVVPFLSLSDGMVIADKSVGHRVSLLKKGLCFAQNRILVGYGISNRHKILTSKETQHSDYFKFCNKNYDVFHYSHFHNGFLTAFIDAGIFGLLATIAMLLAPLVLALTSPKDNIRPLRIAVALCLTSVYTAAGLTNLLFGHDLIDAIFLIFCLFLTLSVEERRGHVYSYSIDMNS